MARRGATGWLDLGSGWLFTVIRDAVLVLEADTGRLAVSNPSASDLLGYTPEQLRGASIDHLVPDLRVMPLWDTLLAGPAPAETIPLYAERRDGSEISVEVTLSRLESPSDGRLYLIAVVRDITDRRLAE